MCTQASRMGAPSGTRGNSTMPASMAITAAAQPAASSPPDQRHAVSPIQSPATSAATASGQQATGKCPSAGCRGWRMASDHLGQNGQEPDHGGAGLDQDRKSELQSLMRNSYAVFC